MLFSRRKKAKAPTCIRRLLVVEDDPLLAFDHEHGLAQAGYTVVATVNNAAAAIAAITDHPIDAIILDLHLSGMADGQDVAQEAHRLGIAVLIVSGTDAGAAADYSFGWLRKPIANGALVAALHMMEGVLCHGVKPRRITGLTVFGGVAAQ